MNHMIWNLFPQVDSAGLVSSYESESPLRFPLVLGDFPLMPSWQDTTGLFTEGQSKFKRVRVKDGCPCSSVDILVAPPLYTSYPSSPPP